MTERLAICSVITNDFIDYLEVFCKSILEKCPDFDRDYLVFYWKKDLNKIDFDRLNKIYDNFIFKEVDEESYKLLIDESYKKNIKRNTKIKIFAYARIEMFKQIEYEQIIYFDVDMIVNKNISELLNLRYDEGIIASEDILVKQYGLVNDNIYKKDHLVQGGVIVAGKKVINLEVYNDLINLLINSDNYRLNDQSMFIDYFGGKKIIRELNFLFNCPRKLIRDKKVNLNQVYIIHFSGTTKPYNVATKRFNYDCYTFKNWHNIKRVIKGENKLLIFSKAFIYWKPIIYLTNKFKNLGKFKFN